MEQIYIYLLKHPETMEIRYIGKTLDIKRRLSSHIAEAKRGKSKRYILNWIRKLLHNNLKPVIEVIEICNEFIWQEREIYWIDYYRNSQSNLCNICKGGRGGPCIKNFTKEQLIVRANTLRSIASTFTEDEKLDIWNMILNKISLIRIQLVYPRINRNHIFQAKSGRSWNNITGLKLVKSNKVKCIGEKHPAHKITQLQVNEIKSLYQSRKYTQKQLSIQFNVSQTLINHIINNKKWKHI